MDTLGNESAPKKGKKYACENCDYVTTKKSHYDRHVSTQKHNWIQLDINDPKKVPYHKCTQCNKIYKTKGGLWKHSKKCQVTNDLPTDIDNNTDNYKLSELNIDYKSMFLKMMEDNSEFKALLVEQQKQLGELIPKVGNTNNTNNTNNINNNNTANINQKFNIKVFLNEQCKDAMNMSDFIKNIEITMANLDTTRYKGLAEGLSCAIIENMSSIDLHKRPIHCTDLKRDAVYIKNADVWVKDNSEKTNLKKVVKDISLKQFKTLQTWTHQNPGFKDDDAKSTYFAHAVSNVSKDPASVDDKVIKRICNAVYLKDSLD